MIFLVIVILIEYHELGSHRGLNSGYLQVQITKKKAKLTFTEALRDRKEKKSGVNER